MSFDHSSQAEKRILWQYRNGANYRAWIDTLPGIAQQDIESTSLQLRNVLALENANTWQLDIIGRIVGQTRTTQQLQDDAIYRSVIRSQIAQNNSFATIDGIIEAVEFVTQDEVLELIDGLDMSFTIVFDDPIDPVIRDLILTIDLLPRPQGVKFSGFIEPQALPKFGVDGLGTEQPASDVEGFGELGMHALEFEDGTVLELEDGSALGMIDQNDPILPTEGGKLAELFEV